MTYLYVYFGVGLIVLTTVFAHHRLTLNKDSNSKSFNEILDATNPDRNKLSYKILNNYVAPTIGSILVVIAWPIVPIMKYKDFREKKKLERRRENAIFRIKDLDLLNVMTLQQVESKEIIIDPLGAVPKTPFGHFHIAWEKFKKEIEPNCEVMNFSTIWTNEWDQKKIVSGYVIVKSGKIGKHFITKSTKFDPA